VSDAGEQKLRDAVCSQPCGTAAIYCALLGCWRVRAGMTDLVEQTIPLEAYMTARTSTTWKSLTAGYAGGILTALGTAVHWTVGAAILIGCALYTWYSSRDG
jgi:hypothetical protein